VRAAVLALALTGAALPCAQALAQEGAAEQGAEHGGEHAAGPGEHAASVDPKTLALQVLNFGVLLFVLIKFGAPAINKALRGRHEQLKTDLDEAGKVRRAAEERFRHQEQRLANLEREIEVMLQSIRQEAEQEKARIIASAEEKARRIQDETKFSLEQQVKEAEVRFRAEVAQAAVKVAEELLRRSVTPSDEQRLAQSFIADLAAARPPQEGQKGPPRGGKAQEEVVG
jgi:F-type H+-transporting ATPase subunit b